jgi:hypothetical protein
MEHIENIGDMDVYADDHFAQIKVDGEVVLAIPRADAGLDQLAAVLQSLVK